MEIRSKEFPFRAELSGTAAEDLQVINRDFALAPLTAEQVYIRRMALCNDRYDRTGERFPLYYLERFRDTLVGKSLLLGHDRKQLPSGRFFRAEVVRGPGGDPEGTPEGGHWLQTSVYLVKTPAKEELRAQIDGGVVAHVSVGFRWADLVCDLCGRSYYRGDCPHQIGQSYDGKECTATYGGDPRRVEAVEASLVFLGAQYGSVITKSPARKGGETGMDAERKEGRADPAADPGGAAGAAGGGTVVPAASDELPAAVRGLVEDGRQYREELRAEVLRLGGLLGAEREARFLCQALADQPAPRWKELLEEYQARFDALFPPLGTAELPAPRQRSPEGAPGAPSSRGRRPEFGVI